METDASSGAVVSTIVGLSRALGVNTIAEGVETEHQATLLRAAGCEVVQGYLFGHPAPLSRLARAASRGCAPSADHFSAAQSTLKPLSRATRPLAPNGFRQRRLVRQVRVRDEKKPAARASGARRRGRDHRPAESGSPLRPVMEWRVHDDRVVALARVFGGCVAARIVLRIDAGADAVMFACAAFAGRMAGLVEIDPLHLRRSARRARPKDSPSRRRNRRPPMKVVRQMVRQEAPSRDRRDRARTCRVRSRNAASTTHACSSSLGRRAVGTETRRRCRGAWRPVPRSRSGPSAACAGWRRRRS